MPNKISRLLIAYFFCILLGFGSQQMLRLSGLTSKQSMFVFIGIAMACAGYDVIRSEIENL